MNNKVILVRCIINYIGKEYIKGTDYQGNKYLIENNVATRNFILDEDRCFYAVLKEAKGIIHNKSILCPLTNEEYLKSLGDNRIGDKTLRELGISLNEI